MCLKRFLKASEGTSHYLLKYRATYGDWEKKPDQCHLFPDPAVIPQKPIDRHFCCVSNNVSPNLVSEGGVYPYVDDPQTSKCH